jgi:N-acetyl-anhydromuramyl-L-alanine amidase AmpD
MATKFIQTPFFTPRNVSAIDTVVIHHTGSNRVGGAIRWFTDEECHRNKDTGKVENKVSAHYIIPRELYQGFDIIQCAKHEDTAWHAGRSTWAYSTGVTKSYLNKNSIGIELAGNGNEEDYTEFQYEVLIKLLKELTEEFNIPAENVVGHSDIAPKRKVDPGKNFDWLRIKKALRPGLNQNADLNKTIEDTIASISKEAENKPHDNEDLKDLLKAATKKPEPVPVKDEDFIMNAGTDDNATMQALVKMFMFIGKVLYFMVRPK